MKKIFYIFLLISNIGLCQSDSLNPILKFVYDHHEKKIGRGICYELVAEAVNYKNNYSDFVSRFNNQDTLLAHEISRENIRPGDIIVFVGTKFKDGIYFDAHMGIITDISGDSLLYANQNMSTLKHHKFKTIGRGENKIEVVKDSRVLYAQILFSDIISGEVKIYRF